MLHKGQLGKGAKFSIELGRKAVGNMSSSGNLTGSYFVPPTVVPGIVLQPYNQVHLRDVLSTGTTNSNVIRHLRDNGGEGGPTTVAEGGTKPQMDRDLSIVDANVRKIATYLRVPEEMIEDIPYLTSFLTNIGTEEVLALEDTQILYGDGTGQNLSGLATAGNFTAFAAGSTVIGASSNRYDVLGMSSTQMRLAKRNPSVHLVNPRDYFEMVSAKDTTNNYILRGGGNGILPVDAGGTPIVQMNQVASGDFITIDSRAAQIFFRSNINVRFYEQDQDNAIKNMVTIVIEERLALPIYFVTGIIKGTFAAGITDLTS
jgi:HK97 family phage major capsid protein